MYLSRLRLNPLSRDVARDAADVSQMHRTIMRAFPAAPEGVNPREYYSVLYRLEANRRSGTITLYVQSAVQPNWSTLPAHYALDGDNGQWPVKRVDHLYETIGPGRRLRFRLRANPTRKIDTKTGPDGVRRHGRRVPVRGEQAQVDWLRRQGERHGFAVRTLSIQASGAPELKRSRIGGRTFQGVLYDGTLQVVDAEAFKRALAKGIGPAKAFGFGLLSIASE